MVQPVAVPGFCSEKASHIPNQPTAKKSATELAICLKISNTGYHPIIERLAAGIGTKDLAATPLVITTVVAALAGKMYGPEIAREANWQSTRTITGHKKS